MNKKPESTINKRLEEEAYKLLNQAEQKEVVYLQNELKAIVEQRIPEASTSLRIAVGIRRRLKEIFELLNNYEIHDRD